MKYYYYYYCEDDKVENKNPVNGSVTRSHLMLKLVVKTKSSTNKCYFRNFIVIVCFHPLGLFNLNSNIMNF